MYLGWPESSKISGLKTAGVGWGAGWGQLGDAEGSKISDSKAAGDAEGSKISDSKAAKGGGRGLVLKPKLLFQLSTSDR